ncbi:MAG: dipeptidase PepE [Rikenellaceae bacterium]
MKLLLLSNSTNAGEDFLEYSLFEIEKHLKNVKSTLFIPYAAVGSSYDSYFEMTSQRLSQIGIKVTSAHHYSSPNEAVIQAESICVGGGNTFALLHKMQQLGLVEAISERVIQGVPYLGWSAGSNVTSPTIATTNDMPIIEPESLNSLGLIPFQINPHYIDTTIQGHAGESREQRIEEYLYLNRKRWVVGLREGTMLKVDGDDIHLLGDKTARIFRYGETPRELSSKDSLQFLLK